MSNFKKDLEKMLKNLRLACGFTQYQVADVLNIDRSTYTYYESGKTSPDIATLRRIATLFSIPPEAFLFPEKYGEMDIKKLRVRSFKIPRIDPQRIGELTAEERELTAEERELIAAYRLEK